MSFPRLLVNYFSESFLRGRLRPYLDILALGSGVRVFGLISQFVVLIMLSRFLPKDSFGDLMTAFGFYRLAGVALGVGGSLVLLFHVSRHPGDIEAEVRLQRFSSLVGLIPSALVAVAALFLAEPVAGALGKPALAPWLQELAPFLVFNTLLTISTGALEGRSRISESIFLGEAAPNAVRIVLLPLVSVLYLPEAYVAHVLTLSVLVPWLWSSRRMWNRSVRGWQPWSEWDYRYCGKFVVATLFANQLGAADIVVASVLFSSATVADYAVAARLAALFTFFQIALLKRFAPRAGQLLHADDDAGLRREVDLCRRLTVACVALTIAGVLLLAPLLLPLLGNYLGARSLLTWLAIPSFVQAFYATADRLLIIAGQANVALLLTASSFAVLTTTPFATAHWLGPLAIAGAMIFSMLAFNPIVAVRARQLMGIRTVEPLDAALMAAGCIALAGSAVAGSYVSTVLACGVLGGIAAYYIVTLTAHARRAATSSAGDAILLPDKASR